MEFTPKMTYKGRPLVRKKNEIYYGALTDPFVIFMQVLTTKEENGMQVADKVNVVLLSTDAGKTLPERIIRQSTKTGLFGALAIGNIWLERAEKEASQKKA